MSEAVAVQHCLAEICNPGDETQIDDRADSERITTCRTSIWGWWRCSPFSFVFS